jgi:hypothetical protein
MNESESQCLKLFIITVAIVAVVVTANMAGCLHRQDQHQE